jgi:hypothetical protein
MPRKISLTDEGWTDGRTDRGKIVYPPPVERGLNYASYQVLVHLAKRFQRGFFLEIDKPETRIAYDGHVC